MLQPLPGVHIHSMPMLRHVPSSFVRSSLVTIFRLAPNHDWGKGEIKKKTPFLMRNRGAALLTKYREFNRQGLLDHLCSLSFSGMNNPSLLFMYLESSHACFFSFHNIFSS
jgi:hypothetical protein